MHLGELKDNENARKKRIRVGRGHGSGKGKTAGRGQKGQKSRSGVAIKGFEGGQMPIYRRLPKRGFNSPFKSRYAVLNLDRLQTAIDQKKIDAEKIITQNVLIDSGLVRRSFDGISLLGNGELKTKIEIKVKRASKSVVNAIEKLGGKLIIEAQDS